MVLKVLITREANSCGTTAKAVKALGFEPILHPLIEIEQVAYNIPTDFTPNYIIITSINAARVALNEDSLLNSPFLVVGEKSAEYLSNNGLNVEAVYADSAALLRDISKYAPGIDFLYLSGDHTATDLPASLAKLGHSTRRVIVYKSKKVEQFDVNALSGIDIVTFYSPRTARIFYEHITTESAHVKLTGITAVCLSPNIAKVLGDITFKSIRIAETPEEESLLKVLRLLL